MFVTNPWGSCTEAIDKKTCDKIIRLGHEKFETVTQLRCNDSVDRMSDIVWLNDEQWLFDLVWTYMVSANKASGWNFDITQCESLQLTRYKEGEFYNFHIDDHGVRSGLCRKLSMTVVLNSDYEGGEFQFSEFSVAQLVANEKYTIITPENSKKTGSIIVFPSFIAHRVTPVTKGVRYSLVVWFLGPPFK